MADARYVIDIILNARDNTSEAFGKLLGNQRELQRIQGEQEKQNERMGSSFENMTRRINTSQAELIRRQKEIGAGNEAQVNAMVKLEQAAQRYARAQGDANASDAQRVQALNEVRKAEDSLVKSMGEGDRAAQRRAARAVSDAQTQVEALKAVRAEADKIARAEAQAERERQQNHARTMRDFTEQARARQRFREEERRAMQKEEEERRREHQKTIDIINRSESEAQRRRQSDLQDVLRIEQQRRQATEQRLRKEEQELQLGRRYLEQIQKIQRVEEERKRAAERGDFVTKARLEFDSKQARVEAAETAASLQELFSNIEANVDLDTGAMTAHAAEVMAMKELLGRDLKINVDFDVDLADIAKVNAMSGALKSVSRDSNDASQRLGLLRGSLRAASEGFHGSSQTISSFDNFLRGLMSLGIATFFNQLFLLTSAAAGAMFSLASSAAMAGAAVGGSLVAGIAQAFGPLGLLAAAAQRVAAVMNAVQQANLLQQQQSSQGAQAARQQANAVDQVRGAEERLADAGRRVRDAQQNVNDARQDGIDKLNELILAERGLSLTVEESEAAIRRAASTGDTSALPRAFLRRDEARADLASTRQEIGERQAAGPGGSPEITAAKEGLADAQRAAKEAQRSLDGAKRSAAEAEAGVTAAAGKLNFLLGQLSGAERRLYNAILRLQTVWRDFAQFATEPLINSFTRSINRVVELLQSPRIRNAARAMSEAMAKQFDRIFDAFTNNRAIGQMLRIMDQARENLRPLATIAINIGKAFLDIAEAAGPAFREIIDWVRDISERVKDFFEQGRKSGELTKFFKDGVTHLKAWGDLIWQVIRLFAALAGPGGGAKNGLALVREMADAIRSWADAIQTPGTKLNEFFQRFFRLSRQMIEAMAPVLGAIAKEFDKTFNKDGLGSVKGFSTFLATVLIPAVGNFARAMGRVTAAMGEFLKTHPGLAKIASAVLAMSFGISVLGRAFAIFGGITRPIGFLVGRLGEALGLTTRLGGAATRTGAIFARIRPIVLGPWGALAAVLIILLQRAGKLDDIWRKILDTGKELWRELQPGFEDLKESVETLVDSFSQGGGLLDVFTAIASVIGDVLLEAINSLGILLQNVGRGVLRVFGGLMDFVSALMALFRGDFDEAGRLALRGVRKVAQGILDALWGVLSGISGFFIRLFRRAIEAVLSMRLAKQFGEIAERIVNGIWNGLKEIASFFRRAFRGAINGVSDFIHSIGDELEDLGVRIIKAIARGIAKGAGAVKDAVGDAASQVPDVTPWKGLTPFAVGGPVYGSGTGTSDSVRALLSTGEHVLTAAEVAAAGGHGAIFALRRRLGGGGQGSGGRFARGGAVAPGMVGVTFSGNLDAFSDAWGDMWDAVVTTARRGANAIEAQIKQLRDNTARMMQQIYYNFRSRLSDMEDSADVRTKRIERFFNRSFGNVQDTVYEGLRYVSRATNDSLDAFDAKPVQVSLRRPKGHAAGGWIGSSGERGPDAVHALLGRGEAVLNYAHQKVVNSALWNQYGTTLDGLFRQTSAAHAGSPMGFAEGGYTGPGHSGAGFTPVWNMAKKKFGMTYFTGYDGHNQMTSSGNVSDHFMHRALDMGNGVLTAGEDALNAFIKTKIPQTVKQLIWRDKDQFNGYPIGGHQDHVHFAMSDQFAFNGPLMAKLISRSLRGLSVARLLAGVTDSDSFDVDHVDRVGVKGTGPLRDLVLKMINKARKAANRFIDKKANVFGGGTDELGLHGEAYDGPLDRVFPSHGLADEAGHVQLSPGQVAGLASKAGLPGQTFEQIAHGESNYYPGIISYDGGYGLWQNTPRVWGTAALEFMKKLGGVGQLLNPWKNALMAKFLYQAAGNSISPWFGTKYVTAAKGFLPQFAKGGQVPGGEGRPVEILAHAGEWVLNKAQQSRLAQTMGTTTSAIKSLLGFSGASKTHYQDGGEIQAASNAQMARAVAAAAEAIAKAIASRSGGAGAFERGRDKALARGSYEAPLLDPESLKGIEEEVDRVFLAIKNISKDGKLGKRLDKFLKNIKFMTDENGLLDQMGERIDAIGERMGTALELAQVGFRRVGNKLLRRPKGPLADAVEIADRTVEMYDKIGDAIQDARQNAQQGLRRTNNRIDEIKKGGIKKNEEDDYVALMGARTRFMTELDDLDSKFAENRKNRFDARLEQFNAATEKALRPTTQRAAQLNVAERIADIFGQDAQSAGIGQQQLGNLQEQQKIIGQRYQAAAAKARRNPRFQKAADDLLAQWQDIQVSIAEQIHRNLENGINLINSNFERARGDRSMWQRIGDAFGIDSWAPGLVRDQISLAQQQIAALQAQLPAIWAAGDAGLYNQVVGQIQDLTASIAEGTAQLMDLAIEAVDKQFANSQRLEGISGRFIDLRERAGDRLGAIAARQVLGASQLNTMQVARSQFEALRLQTFATGDQGAFRDLTEKIEELNIAIAEQTQANRDLTFQYRQMATEIITGRVGRSTGLIATAQDILEKVGAISGIMPINQIIAFVKESGDQLRAAAQQIATNVASGSSEFGGQGQSILTQLVNAFRQGPNSFATTLAQLGPAIAALEATMGDTQRAAFQALIQSMIDNTTAVLDNTDELQKLTGTSNIQNFSTTLWQRFRQAIFSGVGDILPKYDLPSAASGAYIRRSGALQVHAGETIIPAEISRGGIGGGDTYIEVNEAGGPIDVLSLARTLEFQRKLTR